MSIRDVMADDYPDALMLDGFDDAIIGISTDGRTIYSYDLMLAVVAQRGGEDAADFLSYGTLRVLDYLAAEHADRAPVVVHLHSLPDPIEGASRAVGRR